MIKILQLTSSDIELVRDTAYLAVLGDKPKYIAFISGNFMPQFIEALGLEAYARLCYLAMTINTDGSNN